MKLFKNRTLRFDILTVFLFLIALSSLTITTFTYERNLKSILKFSRSTIDRVGVLVAERIQCLFHQMETIPKISEGILIRHPVIGSENTELISRFLDEVEYNDKLFSMTAGAPDGGFITAFNLKLTGRSALPQNAPSDSAYAILIIEASEPTVEKWSLYNAKRGLLLSTTQSGRGFDPRTRPWYTGAAESGKRYWSDFFPLIYAAHNEGMSISYPVYSPEDHKLIGVLATILSFDAFSEFLSDQKIGERGQIFVLDSSGEIVVPRQAPDAATQQIIARAKIGKEKDQVIEYNNEKYLISLQSFPLTFERNWQVLVIAPFLDYFSELIETQHQAVLISILILILAAILAIFFAHRISKPIVILASEINKIKQLDLESSTRVESNIKEINLLDSSIAAMRSALRSFNRYVPKEIVKKLVHRGQDIVLGGERKEITLFFTDITELTPIAESLPLETFNTLLAEYFDGMSKIILKDLGTIDKYIGDSILAYWGAPDPIEDHAVKACIAAIDCQEFVSQFNQKQKAKGMPELFTRIGVNTGEVIAGNIGTNERMNYTVMGDAVNTGERLEQINKLYRTKIIIGEEVVQRIDDQFLIRPLDVTDVKGKKEKVRIYELIAKKERATPEQVEFVNAFTEAYEAYHAGGIHQAKALFEQIHNRFPDDYPTQLYLARIAKD